MLKSGKDPMFDVERSMFDVLVFQFSEDEGLFRNTEKGRFWVRVPSFFF